MTQARLLAVVLLSSLVAPASARSSGSLFDEYRSRDFGRFEADLKNITDFKPLLDEARAASSSWPLDVGAAYLLEVSAAAAQAEVFPRLVGSSDVSPSLSFSGGPIRTPLKEDWQALFDLAEQSTKRTPPTSPVARAWARAAVALLEGADEIWPQTGAGLGPADERLRRLLLSMGDRLDDETVLMAKGSIYEAKAAVVVSYDLPTAAAGVPSPSGGPPIQTTYPTVVNTLDRAFDEGTKIFTAAETYPKIRAEAAVRWGALALLRGRPGDIVAALSHFKLARTWNPDSDVLYVSWVLEGHARQLVGDTDAATAAFKRAAELMQSGSAAKLGLAVQVFLAGDSTTAGQLSEQLLDSATRGADAWVLFQRGDYRNWARRVDDLRNAIQ